MTTLCQNCRHTMPHGAAHCPECGAPQLRVASLEEREAEQAAEGPVQLQTGDIAWPAAVQSAALFAVPAGLVLLIPLAVPAGLALSIPLPLISMLGVVAGAVWTLRRYHRLAPGAPLLTPRLGGRIGLVLGLFAALISTAAEAMVFLMERYTLHQGGSLIDSPYQVKLRQTVEQATQMNPDAAEQLRHMLTFLLSPEGVGAATLFSVAVSALSVLTFAWLTGRFAVRYSAGRKRSQP